LKEDIIIVVKKKRKVNISSGNGTKKNQFQNLKNFKNQFQDRHKKKEMRMAGLRMKTQITSQDENKDILRSEEMVKFKTNRLIV